LAAEKSPRFYAAFQAAVRAARSVNRRGQEYAGVSAVFFNDQVDDSYSRVDAGNEALERGDRAAAIQQAVEALSLNPANADALVLKAFAEYDGGDKQAAIADAQAALVLDPGNQQAYAILGLTMDNPGQAKAALDGIAQSGMRLSDDGRSKGLPRLDDRVDGRLEPEPANPFAGGTPSATPGVGRMLAMDLNVKAVQTAKTDPKASMGEIGAAMALDPHSESVKSWYATIANRAGNYPAALNGAELDLKTDPNDALAFYNKAYALAGQGDKAGMIAALEQAARLDPKFAPAAEKARAPDFTSNEAMEILFGANENRYEPAAPSPRRGRDFTVMLMLGLVGGFFLVGGASLYFRGPDRPRLVKI
jgi:tetratricopeptide (TPR) repeat protein